jgi:hypothetical protein
MKIDYNLRLALITFVPLKMIELLRRYDKEQIQLMFDINRDNWAEVIASKGDIVQFRGGKPDETTKAFGVLVSAIACMCILKDKIEIFDTVFIAPVDIKKFDDTIAG